jgi:hypothetical protein
VGARRRRGGAFDRIAHDHLLALLGTFPARGMVKQWLKAGTVENGRFTPTEEGTPQGGVISPVLLNVALHGMEQAAGVRYDPNGWARADSPVLVRYADDLVALCHSRHEAEQVKARLAAWLTPRGLVFNEDKTRVVTLDAGFDFLGIQRPPLSGQAADQTEQGGRETNPGTVEHRVAVPARDQRTDGDQTTQPHHQGMGRLLPDPGLQRGLLRAR